MVLKRTNRLTHIEQLPDGEQIFVFRLLDARPRPSTDTIAAEYREKFKKPLAGSVVRSYLARRRLPAEEAAERRLALSLKWKKYRDAHAEIPEDALLRGFLADAEVSEEFLSAELHPKTVITTRLKLRELDLEERRVKAVEENNRITGERMELEKQKLVLVREKVRGLREDVGKKKLSGEELQRRLDDLYGIAEKKN